jgi:hypothetical protein
LFTPAAGWSDRRGGWAAAGVEPPKREADQADGDFAQALDQRQG